MWCVLFGGGGEDVLIPIEVYSVYIRGPSIQKFGDGIDRKAGTIKERPRGCALTGVGWRNHGIQALLTKSVGPLHFS
jgi:hypothetical protein